MTAENGTMSRRSRLVQKLLAREWFESLVATIVIALLLRIFIIEPFRVPSESMQPTLLPGDYIFALKSTYGVRLPLTELRFAERLPKRGDVVLLRHPVDESTLFVKRVVGLPGDRVFIENGILSINDVIVTESSAEGSQGPTFSETQSESTHQVMLRSKPNGTGVQSEETYGPMVVPPNSVFVLGDDRDRREDSRYWGPISTRLLEGRVWLIWFSFQLDEKGFRSIRYDRIMNSIP